MLRPLRMVLFGLFFPWVAAAETSFLASGDGEYPPSSWSHRDELYGVGPTLVRKALEERGVTVRFDPNLPWKRALLMLERAELDIMTSVYRTPAREEVMHFVTEPYMEDRIVVWTKQQPQPTITRLDQLKDKRGLMIIGYSGGQQFDHWAQRQQLTIQRISRIAQCFAMLRAERADYLIFSQQVGEAWVNRLGLTGQFSTLAEPVAIEPLFLAVSRKPEHAWLAAYLGQKIRAYKQSGQIDTWQRQALARFRQQATEQPDRAITH